MKIQTVISFPSVRIACYVVFCGFAHIEDVCYMAFFKYLRFFLSLLWVVESEKRKEKNTSRGIERVIKWARKCRNKETWDA